MLRQVYRGTALMVSGCLLALLGGCGGDNEGGGTTPRPSATPTVSRPPTASPAPTGTASAAPSPTPTPGELNIAVCAPDAGPFSPEIDNPFLPLPGDARWVLVGETDGAPVRLELTVLPATETVAGVTTRVLQEREWEAGDLVEISRNYLAQAADGTVCYFGEAVDIYALREVVSHDGAWRAGENGARPGILMPARPTVGQMFKQEVAPGVAEDQAALVAAGEAVEVGLGTFTDTIRVRESSPLDPGTSEKVYARSVGLLVDDEVRRIDTAPTVCGTTSGAGCAPTAARVDLAAPSFSTPTAVTNPLFPIANQHSVVQLGTVDGEPFRAEVTLLPTTKVIDLGDRRVETLESQYVAYLDGRIVEVALDWYGQADDGSVWYFGEDVTDFEDGVRSSTEGTWLAGRDGPVAMIMPAVPQAGDVYRPENIPALVFEEVTVQRTGVLVAGPYGPVAGAIEVQELHMDGSLEAKTFAPGYGEFTNGTGLAGADIEALAIAVPTDALSAPLPESLAALLEHAAAAGAAVRIADWAAAATAHGAASGAWDAYDEGGATSPRLAAQLEDALDALEEAIAGRDAIDARQAAVDLARAALDFHLRHRPVAAVDRDRFAQWALQVGVDADDDDLGGVRGDAATLAIVLDRFAHTLAPSVASAVRDGLESLRAAAAAGDLATAHVAGQALADLLASAAVSHSG